MDYREVLLNDVRASMIGFGMDPETIIKVSGILVEKLSDYELLERSTSVAVRETSNESLLKYYAGSLITEGKSEKTVNEYLKLLIRFSEDVEKPLLDVDVFDVRVWLAALKKTVSDRTCENYRSYLASFYHWATIEEFVSKNPMVKIKPIAFQSKVKEAFSDVDVDKMRSACTTLRDRAILEVLLSTGVRISEMCALDIKDLNFSDGSVIVRKGKGNKQRITYMSNVCKEYIRQYLDTRDDNEPCLFLSRYKSRIALRTAESAVKKLGSRCGVENTHPHRFRRTFAVNLLKRDVNIRTIQILMGHASLDMTQQYLNIDTDYVRHQYEKSA